jgi:ribosomal protein S18 acetylase RimI-like enzyme
MPVRNFTFRDIFFICDLDEKEFSKDNGPCAMTSLRCMAEPATETLIYTHDQVLEVQLGFAIVQWKQDRSYLALIATIPEARNQGVGKALLEECIRRMREAYGPHVMQLHVAQHNNGARKFFTDCGFEAKNFQTIYKNSGEMALLMVRHLS